MGLLEHTRFELRDDAARRHHARAEERTRRADLERARSLDEGIGIVDEKHRAVSMEIGEVARAKTPEVASLEREPPFDHAVEKKRLEGGEVKPRHARPEPPEGPAPVLSAPQKVLEDAPLLAIGARNALERLAPAKLLEEPAGRDELRVSLLDARPPEETLHGLPILARDDRTADPLRFAAHAETLRPKPVRHAPLEKDRQDRLDPFGIRLDVS